MHQEEPGGTAKVANRYSDTLSKVRSPGSYCRAGPYPLVLLLALIHPSSGKSNSRNFTHIGFSAVRVAPVGPFGPDASRNQNSQKPS